MSESVELISTGFGKHSRPGKKVLQKISVRAGDEKMPVPQAVESKEE
jgi:hypothetical protein